MVQQSTYCGTVNHNERPALVQILGPGRRLIDFLLMILSFLFFFTVVGVVGFGLGFILAYLSYFLY
jgi:hypothetical protein